MAAPTVTTRERILVAAERLFAKHGLEGPSFRQISAAAGNGNNGAVQYHFRSKTELVRAIFDYRMPAQNARRTLLVAQRRPDDLRSWVECSILPLCEDAERKGSHHARFVAMMLQHDPAALQRLPDLEGMILCLREILALLSHIPEPYRSDRLLRVQMFGVYAAADRERAHADRQPVLPFEAHMANLVDGLVAFLDAPLSRDALAALPALPDHDDPDERASEEQDQERGRGGRRLSGQSVRRRT